MRSGSTIWKKEDLERSIIHLKCSFLSEDSALSGSTIAASIEGLRPLLIETQALVSPAIYGNPQRSSTGF